MKKQWGKLIKGASALYVEEVRKFYVNCEPFNLNDHSITFTISCLLLPEIINPGFSYKGIYKPFQRLR
jgi:hypothetical protein